MSRWSKTPEKTALVASFDRDGAAYAPTTNPADLRNTTPNGKRPFSRTKGTAEEAAKAAELIRAQKVQALVADFGPNERLVDLIGTL